jgi:hypothetical protein
MICVWIRLAVKVKASISYNHGQICACPIIKSRLSTEYQWLRIPSTVPPTDLRQGIVNLGVRCCPLIIYILVFNRDLRRYALIFIDDVEALGYLLIFREPWPF